MPPRTHALPPIKEKDPKLAKLYAKLRKEFTAADLLAYFEVDTDWVPLEQVLAELDRLSADAKARRARGEPEPINNDETEPGELDMPSREDRMPPITEKDPKLAKIYAKLRKEFTAADLQQYAEVDTEWVPFEQVVAEADRILKKAAPKGQGKKRSG